MKKVKGLPSLKTHAKNLVSMLKLSPLLFSTLAGPNIAGTPDKIDVDGIIMDNTRETAEKPTIILRPVRDNLWGQIKEQYPKKFGDTFTLTSGSTTIQRTVDILPYFEYVNGKREYENLKDVYKRIIIHHSDITPVGSAINQANTVRDEEVIRRSFNDICYHFIIAADGTILEGRPLGRVGANAGESKEANDAAKNALPGGVSSLFTKTGDAYTKALSEYIEAMKKDPDYGSIGICLCGNFETGNPTKEQLASLTKLLNRLKTTYVIPQSNIIEHNQVKEDVVEASGYTLASQITVCPGKNFSPSKLDEINKNLDTDTPQALSKSILLK